ncbi:MAG: DegV family protein [Bacillota bacterium]
MSKARIVTDSTCDLPPDILSRHNISVVPLYVVFADESLRDGVDITPEKLYARVDKDGILPKTAAASPADFVNVFSPIIEAGDDIVYIGISSLLSSSVDNARLAAQEFPQGKIQIVDSLNLSNGIGLLVMKAVDLAEQGFSSIEIVEKVSVHIPKVKSRFIIDTLDYLYMGGRCNALQNFVGGLLKIKPVVAVKEGKMYLEEKIRGKREKVINVLLENVMLDADNMDDARVFIPNSMALEDALCLKEILTGRLNVKEIIIADAGCVISSHCGPNTIGIMYIAK